MTHRDLAANIGILYRVLRGRRYVGEKATAAKTVKHGNVVFEATESGVTLTLSLRLHDEDSLGDMLDKLEAVGATHKVKLAPGSDGESVPVEGKPMSVLQLKQSLDRAERTLGALREKLAWPVFSLSTRRFRLLPHPEEDSGQYVLACVFGEGSGMYGGAHELCLCVDEQARQRLIDVLSEPAESDE